MDSNNISVLLGDGTGHFSPKIDFDVGYLPHYMDIGDLNGDEKLDLVTANSGSHSVSVLLGDGTGHFSPKIDFPVESHLENDPNFVLVKDLNDDKNLDIITPNWNSNSISVLLGDGTGHFSPKTNFFVGKGPYAVTVGDFNNDKQIDIVSANEVSNTISLLLAIDSHK